MGGDGRARGGRGEGMCCAYLERETERILYIGASSTLIRSKTGLPLAFATTAVAATAVTFATVAATALAVSDA